MLKISPYHMEPKLYHNLFNSIRATKNHVSSTHRHNRDRETPAPIYLALKIHGETRKKGLVDTLHNMGLCISYDHLLGISTDIANKVCAMYGKEGVVCPPKLSRNVFTVAAVDNIDHNPSSATARDSFHGTGISLMQLPSEQHDPVIDENPEKTRRIQALPAAYTNVPPVALIRQFLMFLKYIDQSNQLILLQQLHSPTSMSG